MEIRSWRHRDATGTSSVYVGWRLLGLDPSGIASMFTAVDELNA